MKFLHVPIIQLTTLILNFSISFSLNLKFQKNSQELQQQQSTQAGACSCSCCQVADLAKEKCGLAYKIKEQQFESRLKNVNFVSGELKKNVDEFNDCNNQCFVSVRVDAGDSNLTVVTQSKSTNHRKLQQEFQDTDEPEYEKKYLDSEKFCYDHCYPSDLKPFEKCQETKVQSYASGVVVEPVVFHRKKALSSMKSDNRNLHLLHASEDEGEMKTEAHAAVSVAHDQVIISKAALDGVRKVAKKVYVSAYSARSVEDDLVSVVDNSDSFLHNADRYVHSAEKISNSAAQKQKQQTITKTLEKADEEAHKKASKIAEKAQAELAAQGKVVAGEAMKTYMDAMGVAVKRAGEYQSAGDALAGQSIKLQQQAGIFKGQSKEAEKYGQGVASRQKENMAIKAMHLAQQKTAEANMMYDYAQSVVKSLGGYAGAAGQAATHARELVDPNAPPTPAPLI